MNNEIIDNFCLTSDKDITNETTDNFSLTNEIIDNFCLTIDKDTTNEIIDNFSLTNEMFII